MAVPVTILNTPEALAEKVAQDLVVLMQDRLTRQPRFSLALSGGATPKLFYQRLAQEPYRSQIPWDKLWIFWGDERCVPPEHSDSNFGMAQDALLSRVPLKSSQVMRMHGEDPPPLAAAAYEKELRRCFPDGEWPVFDLILLGMGPDGHTASLMPGTPALMRDINGSADRREGVEPRWVVHNVIRSLQTVRLTLTLPVLRHARTIWFLVTGAKKQAAFAQVMDGPSPQWPASLIQPENGQLHWYIDTAVTGGVEVRRER